MNNSKIYTVGNICEAIGRSCKKDDYISKIVWNSRECVKDSCYIAIKGKKYNGNDYINEARSNGAKLIITDDKSKEGKDVIYVDNSVIALGNIAKKFFSGAKVIGITGSVGKTTVKEMVKSVLAQKYRVHSTLNNENNEIGVAKTLLSCKDGEYCVVEMGMRGRGEIDYLSELCKPETSIITSVGSAHIGLLGSENEIFEAKAEILNHTYKYCILPYEKRFLDLDKKRSKPIYVGKDYTARNIAYTENGVEYTVFSYGIERGRIFLPSFSKHNITNSLFAYSVGEMNGICHSDIANALSTFTNVGMREETVLISDICIVLDCYNASYEGTVSSIDGFLRMCRHKKLKPHIILGNINEVGEHRREYHYRIGEYVKDLGVDSLIAYGEDADSYTDGFCGGNIMTSKHAIAERILTSCGTEDAVLIKGSRGVGLEEIIIEMKELLK